MYKKIIKPILFLFSPEAIHHFLIFLFKTSRFIPCAKYFIRKSFTVDSPSLEREVFGLKFKNPVGMAAGFDKNGEVYNELSCFGFGFIEVGTITPKPQPGNPKPRLFRLPEDDAIINRMGFNNMGVEEMVKNLRHGKHKVIIGGNLGKNTLTDNDDAPKDYLTSFRAMYQYVDYFVVNVSCPNVANLCKLQDNDSLRDILQPLMHFRKGQNIYRPILLKISPDLTFEQVDETLSVIHELKIDGVVATNTTTSREGLTSSQNKINKIGNGGLSGKPLTERSLEIVRYISQKTAGHLPIIGVGGIMTPQDAVNMLDAGASLVQVYSGFIYNGPAFVKNICKAVLEHEK